MDTKDITPKSILPSLAFAAVVAIAPAVALADNVVEKAADATSDVVHGAAVGTSHVVHGAADATAVANIISQMFLGRALTTTAAVISTQISAPSLR